MRIVNENYETINESAVDLNEGYLIQTTAVREDATPIDNVTKFAWFDDDYEEVQVYVLNREEDLPELSQPDELTQIIDVLLGFGGGQNG